VTTVKDIRQALAQAVETTGLRCEPYLSDQINPPCAMVGRREKSPDLVFTEVTQVDPFYISVWVPRAEERTGQEMLDEYFDRTGVLSIKAAIEDGDNWATSLGVDYCKLLSWGEPQLGTDANGGTYITATIDLEVCW
jgi:hypothetical protein